MRIDRLLAALAVTLAASGSQAANLVANGDFDAGVSGLGAGAMLQALLEGRMPAASSVILAAVPSTLGIIHCRWNRQSPAFALAFWLVAVEVLLMLGGGAWARWRNRVVWRGEVIKVSTPPA